MSDDEVDYHFMGMVALVALGFVAGFAGLLYASIYDETGSHAISAGLVLLTPVAIVVGLKLLERLLYGLGWMVVDFPAVVKEWRGADDEE